MYSSRIHRPLCSCRAAHAPRTGASRSSPRGCGPELQADPLCRWALSRGPDPALTTAKLYHPAQSQTLTCSTLVWQEIDRSDRSRARCVGPLWSYWPKDSSRGSSTVPVAGTSMHRQIPALGASLLREPPCVPLPLGIFYLLAMLPR